MFERLLGVNYPAPSMAKLRDHFPNGLFEVLMVLINVLLQLPIWLEKDLWRGQFWIIFEVFPHGHERLSLPVEPFVRVFVVLRCLYAPYRYEANTVSRVDNVPCP